MQRTFDQSKDLFLRALSTSNWNDVAVYATELLQIKDDEPSLWANRGVALQRLGFPLDAILNYDKSISLEMLKGHTSSAINYSNKGAAYWDMGQADKALEFLNKAVEDNPNIAQTYLTIGNILKHQAKWGKALIAYRKSVEVDSDYVDGHMVLGMMLLKAGALEEGWREYEWRWKSDQLPERKLKCPRWNNEDLTNKTILVYSEQGLGDIIQFGRYIRILGNKYPRCKIIVEGRQPVRRLLESVSEAYSVINAGDKLPAVDYAIPMLSLAGMLTPNLNSIFSAHQEYVLKQEDVEAWGERLKQLPDGFRIGVCWAGMSRDAHPSAAAIDVLRSTTLDSFAPVAAISGITWISLQKGPPAEQIKKPPLGMTIGDFTEDMYDFYETCCAIENCDLVISVDTAVVHAAASIGKPTWLLSRWDGCWRWFGDQSDSPWYPSLRQFVQPAPHDWEGLMKEVAKELLILINKCTQRQLDSGQVV